jgi:hypothetical protein
MAIGDLTLTEARDHLVIAVPMDVKTAREEAPDIAAG